MTPRSLLRPAALLAAFAVLGSCGEATGPGEPSAPVPGLVSVTLATPGGREGAVLLAITGPEAPTEITAAQAGVVLHVRPTSDGAAVALFGSVAPGEVLRMRVGDVRAAASYRAAVREVAGEDNALREDLRPYRTTVAAVDR